MEAGGFRSNLTKSLQRSASSWRAPRVNDVFGRSSREENDEEALRWAALEKLPTYDRVRKGILTGDGGKIMEIDVKGLGYEERKTLLERLVRSAKEDNERFLFNLRNRMERVGIENPTIEVQLKNLSINAKAYVGSRGVPTYLNFFTNKIMLI